MNVSYCQPSTKIMAARRAIAIVDCDPEMRRRLAEVLSTRDLVLAAFPTSRAFLQACSNSSPRWPVADMLLCRLELEQEKGLAFLEELKGWNLNIPTVVYSTGGDINAAVSSFHAGALDFIDHAKPDACFGQRIVAALDRADPLPMHPVPRNPPISAHQRPDHRPLPACNPRPISADAPAPSRSDPRCGLRTSRR